MLDRFRDAPPGRQIAAVLAAVLVLAFLLAITWYFLLRTVYQPIFTGLQPADAATIVAELEKRKIPYRLGDNGGAILVPEDRADAVRLDVMSTDLPLKGTVGLELFNTSDMGMTDFAQKINYQRALQGELARTIMAMDGVEAVRVHLALGQDRVFRDDRVPPKASIVVRMAHDAPLPSARAEGIQRLVAAAIDQLDPANVVVLDEAGNVVSNTLAAPSEPNVPSPAAQEKLAIEQYYEARIRRALSALYPDDGVAVSVWAEPVSGQAWSDANEGPASWNPDNRNFRLNVTLSLKSNLNAGSRDEILDLAANAINLSEALGDTIAFGSIPSPLPRSSDYRVPDNAGGAMTPASSASQPIATGTGWLTGVLILIAGLLIGGLLVRGMRNRKAAGRLSESDRMAFADRLSGLLNEEERENATA